MFERIKASRKTEGEGGFTLIELLVVIIILGILAAVVVFAVGGVGDKGQSASCKIDTRTIRTAEEAYYANDKVGLPNYATMAELVSGGFLSEPSAYHTITVVNPVDAAPTGDFPGPGDTPASFTTAPVAPCTS
jgi:general secretion pathway protein G